MNKNELFISKALKVHGDKYDYGKSDYVNAKTKVCIVCPEHGEFWQTPSNHLSNKGCSECGRVATLKAYIGSRKNSRNWDFEQPEEYKLIPLTQGKFTKVDNDDFDRLKDICWAFGANMYVRNDSFGSLHRYIMNAPDGMDVDHINHDTLDNRKNNLRICTRQQNLWNTKPYGSCKYKGVCWDKHRNKWLSYVTFENKFITLGRFNTEEEAARAYDTKAKELFGEFAYLNFK